MADGKTEGCENAYDEARLGNPCPAREMFGDSAAGYILTKPYPSFLLSSAVLETGATYAVYVGGSAKGEGEDRL